MNTDFTPHPPHTNYTATLKLKGTKSDFTDLYNLLSSTSPEDEDEQQIREKILEEIEELIHWIDVETN